jgi:hypothetical protein
MAKADLLAEFLPRWAKTRFGGTAARAASTCATATGSMTPVPARTRIVKYAPCVIGSCCGRLSKPEQDPYDRARPHEPFVGYRINRQLSGWILPV